MRKTPALVRADVEETMIRFCHHCKGRWLFILSGCTYPYKATQWICCNCAAPSLTREYQVNER